jgi:Flp pilus assembly protein TadB
MVFPIAALFAVIKVACVVCGAAFCTHKITKAYKRNQDFKNKKLEYSQEEKRAARERNEQTQPKLDEKEKEHEKQEQKNKQLEKDLEEAKNKANDPNLPEEKKAY